MADVAYGKKHAYLAAWSAGLPENECTGGAWVVDISKPMNPQQVGFLPAARNTYYTEGMQVIPNVNTSSFQETSSWRAWRAAGKTAPGPVAAWTSGT